MASSNIKTLPVRKMASATSANSATPQSAPPSSIALLGRNVSYELQGDTLILYMNISPTSVTNAPLSKPAVGKPNSGGNPVVSSTGGFKYQPELIVNGLQLGISVNVIATKIR